MPFLNLTHKTANNLSSYQRQIMQRNIALTQQKQVLQATIVFGVSSAESYNIDFLQSAIFAMQMLRCAITHHPKTIARAKAPASFIKG